jgi:hypothetical protein
LQFSFVPQRGSDTRNVFGFREKERQDFSAYRGNRNLSYDLWHVGLLPHVNAGLRPGIRTVFRAVQQVQEEREPVGDRRVQTTMHIQKQRMVKGSLAQMVAVEGHTRTSAACVPASYFVNIGKEEIVEQSLLARELNPIPNHGRSGPKFLTSL